MKKFLIHYSKYHSEIFDDIWKFKTVEAETRKDAIDKLGETERVNYILSCEEEGIHEKS